MEKKPNSIRQTSSKGLVSESRKQDVQWPRNGRRREPTNRSNSKSEPIRPSNKQSSVRTNFDKRLRQHGDGYQRGAWTPTSSSNSGLDDETESFAVEINSVYTPGSKKQNLNHLLNFNYAPRQQNDPTMFLRTGNYRNYSAKKNRYNKEHFLQATCQFVVNAEYDYEPYKGCPDTLVEWNYIEQINIQTSEEPQCPICLYPPVAGKMTRCGHVYCWPCILQYLSLSDKAWRKCPICYEAIQVGYLKSTVSKPYRLYSVGDYITLQLMCREKGSLYVSKVNKPRAKDFPNFSDDAEDLMHSKLVMSNDAEVMTIIERERSELKHQLELDGLNCPESIFISQALDLLDEREKSIKSVERVETLSILEQKMNQLKLNADAKPFLPSTQAAHESVEKSNEFIIDEESNLTLQDIEITPTIKDSNHFFFYQASDGQHLYLHSVNVRMLQMMYGSLEKAPHTIRGKIVQKESCSLTEDLRKRLKYLQHLPVTSQFDIVEIGLDQPIVSSEVLIKFKDELMLRQKTRQRRAREERQREKLINEVNDRQIGKILAQTANIDVTSNRQFPSCGSYESPQDPFLPAMSPTTSSEYSQSMAGSIPSTSAGPSFATMLTRQTKEEELWPSLGPSKSFPLDNMPGSSHSSIKNPFPTVANRKVSYNSDLDEVDDDDVAKVPAFKCSFGTAIAEALVSKSKPSTANIVESTPVGSTGTSGKKKKTKKTILFSTSARPFDGK